MTPPRPYSRHGLRALKARVKVRGLDAIDRRTVAARALLDWRKDLLQDLGGEAAVSAAQLALVEAATRTRLYVDHLDAYLLEQRSLVNAKRRAVLPVVKERQALVDSLARLLHQLGLERRARPAPSLAEYLASRYGGGDGQEPTQEAEAQASLDSPDPVKGEIAPPSEIGAPGGAEEPTP